MTTAFVQSSGTEPDVVDAPRPATSIGEGPAHMVHFYESDELLCGVVVDFLAAGLAAGEPTVVIATKAHRDAFSAGLAGRGIDVEVRRSVGQLVLLDADETLSTFMVGASPDWELFKATIEPVLKRAMAAGDGSGRVRAYGEMVDLLWRGGNQVAAVRLEELWNDLQRSHSFSLLCAYVVSNFYKEDGGLHRVCKTHSHVRAPLDGPFSLPSAEHVRALVAEIAQRTEIERALRRSLRELRREEQARDLQSQRAERLNQITAAIAGAVTAEQVFEAVVDQVGSALSASSSGLWLVKAGSPVATLCRANGYADATKRMLDSLPINAQPSLPVLDAIRSGDPVWIGSRAKLVSLYPHLAAVTTPGRNYSIACLPIVTGGRTLGGLAFTFDDARPLDEEQRSFLLLVARYTGQALERLRLLELEQDSRQRAELLYGLAAAVIGADRVESIFEAALDAIERALGTNRSSILVFDAEGVMRFRAWRNLSDGYRRAVEGHSPWSRDAAAPQPVICDDVATDPALQSYLPLFHNEGIGALAFIPLVAGGRLIGKFMVYYQQPRRLAAEELELARAIANHVAAGVSRFHATAELQETVRFNELFTGILGHDLRNPLAAILTSARVAMMREGSDKLQKPLSRILTSGDRMTRMIDQLLDFTRVRVGAGIPLHRRTVDLTPVVRQVMDELDDANPAWTLRLEERGDTNGFWDSDRLAQVFSNLVANAVQHGAAAAGVTVTVDGTARDSVRVAVHNVGAIPGDLLPQVFEPLFGHVRRLEKSRGLGLGLYITKEIVRSHGGQIAVHSDDERGTTFTVDLPRGAAAEGD